MLTRSSYDVCYQEALTIPDATSRNLEVGAESSGEIHTQALPFRFLSFDLYATGALTLDCLIGFTVATLTIWWIYTCPAVARHNTVYDLAPPLNTDGRLILTANWLRFTLNNATGIDQPYQFHARLWR